MRNVLLAALIIIAAIFPYAATGFELTGDLAALAALAVMSLVAVAVTVGALFYRPKANADTDTPLQSIPTLKTASGRGDAGAKGVAKAGAPAKSVANKPDSKRQRAR